MIPAFAFAAYSGTGKTTLLEKVILAFKARGLSVCVIKQDAHRIEVDKEGKDSWRFAHAGADMTIVSGPEKTAIIEQRERTLMQNIAMVHDVDLILVEGYKNEGIPQIGISRKATGRGLPAEATHYIAIVTDDDELYTASIPRFSLSDAEGLADFILERAEMMK